MACGGFGDLGRLWFLAHAAPGGMAGGEPGVATSGAVAGHGQLREFSPFVLQPGIHHPLADMQDPQYRHIRFVRVRNPRQAEALLRELEAQRSAGHI